MASKEALGMSLNISQEYIDNLTKDLLTESLIETLDAKESFVSEIIKNVLSTKVDNKGKVSSYNSDNKYTYLEYLVNTMIKEEFLSITQEVMTVRRNEIREAIRKHLNEKATLDKFYEAFFSTVLDSLDNIYRTTINVSFEPKNNDY